MACIRTKEEVRKVVVRRMKWRAPLHQASTYNDVFANSFRKEVTALVSLVDAGMHGRQIDSPSTSPGFDMSDVDECMLV
jgi:hypothetical protein